MSHGGMHPGRSPVPVMVGECDEANRALFWDGDPTKQSFIRVVGLSTPQAARMRPRPSSAPARRVKTSGFTSPSQDQPLAFAPEPVPENSFFEVGGEYTSWGSVHHHRGENEGPASTRPGREDDEKGRVRVLEHRLRELTQENTCMRDAMLSKAEDAKLQRLAEAQRRNQELIAALDTAKERAERKTQHRVRVQQSELGRTRCQQDLPPTAQQKDISFSKGWLTESQTRASRPHSAPRISLRRVELGAPKPSVTAVAREAGSGKGDGVTYRADHGKDGAHEERETGTPREPQIFVAARPEANANAWRSPSPKRRAKTATSDDRKDTARLASDIRRDSADDGPSNALRIHMNGAGATSAGVASVKEKSTAPGGSREEKSKCLGENTDTAIVAVRKTTSGGNDRSGDRSIHRGTAPKMLLAREAEAAERRAERAAAATEMLERELRLSSSFRAKELRATSGPDWATIKAHQDIVRKQRTRDRAAFLAATSSLPARMARHAAMEAVAADRAGCKRSSAGVDSSSREEGAQGAAPAGVEEPQDIGRVMERRQERWKRSLAAAKAASRMTVTRPRTPPMEKRRLAQEAKRRTREKAERRARKEAAEQRAEDERRQFQKLIATYRDSGSTFRETKASVRKAEETRLRIEQDLEQKEQEGAAELAEEARRREVSRAVREYVAASEARRREEHGAGPPLEELIRRKKEEKKAEYRERRRLNRAGLRQALRKRPNLLERQEKYSQQHSRRLAAQASTARGFLESKEGFAAAGRRALRDVDGGWMAKATADNTFTSKEKVDLGLPEAVADANYGGNDTAGVDTNTTTGNPRETSAEGGQKDPSLGSPQAGASGHDAPSGEGTAHEELLSSSREGKTGVTETEHGGGDSQSAVHRDAEIRGFEKTGYAAKKAASAGSSDRSEGESAYAGTPEEGKEKTLEQENSVSGEGIVGNNEHTVPEQSEGDKEAEVLDAGPGA